MILVPQDSLLKTNSQSVILFTEEQSSRANLVLNCALCEESTKLGTWFLHIIKVILRNGAASDLTFDEL